MYNAVTFSIIIPHKNSYNLLIRLIESIPQDNDIEIIVADNSDEYLALDYGFKNVKTIITNSSFGAGHARNEAIKIASGKWLIFADADDYFEYNAFNSFRRLIESQNDIIYFKCTSRYSDDLTRIANRSDNINKTIDNYLDKQSVESEELLRFCLYVPWGKIIKRSLVIDNCIQFDEVMYSNDVMFSTKLGYYGRQITATKEKLYCVTINQGSLTQQKKFSSLLTRFNVIIDYNHFMKKINKVHLCKRANGFILQSLRYGPLSAAIIILTAIKNRVKIELKF